ncbi:iso-1-cytochrome c [Cichlidogyrus casuarinus]|uniref:Iso-1-cytochrome c n=1 Tax=Cichlidogyrus casuarinus TaxID=1844966 RepID=A0ABD2PQR7_9PLAT
MSLLISGILRKTSGQNLVQITRSNHSWKNFKESKFGKIAVAGVAIGAGIAVIATPVLCDDHGLHVPHLPWSHDGAISSYDHRSVRRGYQVYKEVCAACHSMKYITYRQLIGHVLTEDEAKADAAEKNFIDGPDDNGKMFERPGRITDAIPSPYANDQAARAANNGALPPDLSFIAKGRHGKEDYIFHLLTGYYEAPAGVTVSDGQYYNPYFPGGGIGMARALYDDMIEYEDGTPASTGQMAKDVATYLTWASDRNHDQRKRVLSKAVVLLSLLTIIAGIYKRKRWSVLKSRKIVYKNRSPPKMP